MAETDPMRRPPPKPAPKRSSVVDVREGHERVTENVGRGDEDRAVFSTGKGGAEQLHYHRRETYHHEYADAHKTEQENRP